MIDPVILKRIEGAFLEFSNQQRRYYDTQANRSKLEEWLKVNSPDYVNWTAYHFHAAFSACESTSDPTFQLVAGPIEVQESPQERAARLEARERLAGDGSYAKNFGDGVETEAESERRIFRDIVQEKQQRDLLLKQQAEQRALDQAARERRLADFSDTLQLTTGSIDFTGKTELTSRQMILLTEQYSTKHLRVYNQRREKWLRENPPEQEDWRHTVNV